MLRYSQLLTSPAVLWIWHCDAELNSKLFLHKLLINEELLLLCQSICKESEAFTELSPSGRPKVFDKTATKRNIPCLYQDIATTCHSYSYGLDDSMSWKF